MKIKYFLPILLILFTISVGFALDWCEWQEIEKHSTNTSKGEWIDYNNSEFIGSLGKWHGDGYYTTTDCWGDNKSSCGSVANGLYLNYTLPWTYCPNMTFTWVDATENYYSFNITICDKMYNFTSSGIVYRKWLTNIAITPYCSNYEIMYLGGVNTHPATFDGVKITCNFQNASGIGVPSGIDQEFYAYPKQYLEVGTLPNETYPNVTYKLNLTMKNYVPSCYDTSRLNKYGWFISTVSLLPREISWYKQTTSCSPLLEEQLSEQTHYPFTDPLKAGCKALVYYQNATLNCDFIKYNTTVGSDSPTMTIISPLNSTSPSILNPITFTVNMSNTKCIDIYVKSVNQETLYTEYTVLSSIDNQYFYGVDDLTNGTQKSQFICTDGCSGSEAHNITNIITFVVSSIIIPPTTTVPTTTTTFGGSCTRGYICADSETQAFLDTNCQQSEIINCNSTGDGYCYGGRCYEIPSPAFNSSSSVLDILESTTSGVKGLLGWISLPLFKILLAIGITLLILGIFGLVVSVAEKSTKWSRR